MSTKVHGWLESLLIVLVIGLVALTLVPVFQLNAQESPVKVAFVYPTSIGDGGWSYQHDQGRLYLEDTMGDKVETTKVEGVPEVDAADVFGTLAAQGHDLIIGPDFGQMDPMVQVSQRYPDVAFMHATGFKTTDNMGNFTARIYEASYLAGIVAGYQTDSNLIGYVAAHPIPVVLQDMNAFALGAQSVNENVEVRVVWTNEWFDPATAREAAMSLIDLDADVVAQYQNSPAVVQAAEERGVYGIGFHSNMREFAPDAFLTAPMWNWGPFYVDQARQVLEGTWEPTEVFGGFSDDMVRLAPLADFVDERAKNRIPEVRERIESGNFHPFTGPIYDQDGELMVPEGETISDADLMDMDWLVEGVNGTLP